MLRIYSSFDQSINQYTPLFTGHDDHELKRYLKIPWQSFSLFIPTILLWKFSGCDNSKKL